MPTLLPLKYQPEDRGKNNERDRGICHHRDHVCEKVSESAAGTVFLDRSGFIIKDKIARPVWLMADR